MSVLELAMDKNVSQNAIRLFLLSSFGQIFLNYPSVSGHENDKLLL